PAAGTLPPTHVSRDSHAPPFAERTTGRSAAIAADAKRRIPRETKRTRSSGEGDTGGKCIVVGRTAGCNGPPSRQSGNAARLEVADFHFDRSVPLPVVDARGER